MSVSLHEREDHNPALLPERELDVFLGSLKDLNFQELADATKGTCSSSGTVVIWGDERGVAISRLAKEVNKRTQKETYFMNCNIRSGRYTENVSDSMAVKTENNVAIIDAMDPSRGVISGFEIRDGKVDIIMGNEANFPSSYREARNKAFQTKVQSH